MDDMTVLEKAHREYADRLALPPLDDTRAAIERLREESNGSGLIFFTSLPDVVDAKFIKKMYYKSDFVWPMMFGFSFSIVTALFLFSDKGIVTPIAIGRFHYDMAFLFILSMALLTSSLPSFIESINANMQELPLRKGYFRRLLELSACSLSISSVAAYGAMYTGLTHLTIG